jgi:sec-independent protein translocase protein TatC
MAAQQKEMSFLGHLEELRWHLVRSAAAIISLAVVFFVYSEQVYDYFLLAHIQSDFVTYRFFCDCFNYFGMDSDFCHVTFSDKKLQSIEVTSQLTNSLWSSVILGIIVAFPYLLWEVWRFVAPGLTQNEIKQSRGFILIASLLFFIGVLFSFYVIAPISVHFLYNFQISDNIVNSFTLQSHISLVTNLLIGCSIIFELPVVIYFLTKIGLLTPKFLRKHRKHAFVIVLIVAAIITPPDVASQIIVTIPIMILYEVGILVSQRVIKNQEKNAQKSSRV